MLTTISAGLLAATLTTSPVSIAWQDTPTGVPLGVFYTTEKAAGEQWAVGIRITTGKEGATAFHPAAVRWTGSAWQQTTSAFPDGRLDDVLIRGGNDVWSAGATEYAGDDAPPRPFLQHWTGRAWQEVSTPATDDTWQGFTALSQDSEGNLLVAEDNSVIHRYDGHTWQSLPPAEDGLWIDDVKSLGGKELLAAGIGGLQRFDGAAWHQEKLPAGALEVSQLLVRSPKDIWAVGMKHDDELWRIPMALHYDGMQWTEVPTPVHTDQLHDISDVNGTLYAVGGDPSGDTPLVVRFDGKQFVKVDVPPNATYLHGSTSSGGCLWVSGTGPTTEDITPYIGVANVADAQTNSPKCLN
ncbi:hypothetical protein [Kribbella sp. NPDC055071]